MGGYITESVTCKQCSTRPMVTFPATATSGEHMSDSINVLHLL